MTAPLSLNSMSRLMVQNSPADLKADREMLKLINSSKNYYVSIRNRIKQMIKLYPRCSPEVQKELRQNFNQICSRNLKDAYFAETEKKYKLGFARIKKEMNEEYMAERKKKDDEKASASKPRNDKPGSDPVRKPHEVVSDGQKLMNAYSIVSQQHEQSVEEKPSEFSKLLGDSIVGGDLMMEFVIEDMESDSEPGRNGPDIQEVQHRTKRGYTQEGFEPETRPRSRTKAFEEDLKKIVAGNRLLEDDVYNDIFEEGSGSGQEKEVPQEVDYRTDRENGESDLGTESEPVVEPEIAYRPEGTPFDMTIAGQQDYNLHMISDVEGVEGDEVDFGDDEGDGVTIGLENDEEIAPEYLQVQR